MVILDFVHSAVEARFNLDLDTVNHCETYILNGVPFDKEGFANELKPKNIDFIVWYESANPAGIWKVLNERANWNIPEKEN